MFAGLQVPQLNSKSATDKNTMHHTDQLRMHGCRFAVCGKISQALNFYVCPAKANCMDLRPPKNGAMACDDWILGRFCSPFCNIQWTFSPKISEKLWVCGLMTGTWRPSSRFPDCTSKVVNEARSRLACLFLLNYCLLIMILRYINKLKLTI